jgi:hypothetical protein
VGEGLLRGWSIFIGMILFIGMCASSRELAVVLTGLIRDVKLQNILLTARGVLKLGRRATAPITALCVRCN